MWTPEHLRGVRSATLRLGVAVLAVVGCSLDRGTTPRPVPEITESAIAPLPGNALAAMVSARVRFADSVGVRFGLEGLPPDSSAPAVLPDGDYVSVPVLGLLPETDYRMEVVAYAGDATFPGPPVSFRTGSTPEDLPEYVASGSAPSSGYVVFAAGRYAVAIDNSGRVVWYHAFRDGAGLNLMAQPTGRYVARPPTIDPFDRERWVELDPLGDTVRVLDCSRGLTSRFHDLLVQSDRSYWIMCDERREMDLSHVGGLAAALVTGTVVQHVDARGMLLFEWSAFDHFDIADLEPESRASANVNWTHGNALDLDVDGNLLVSFRNLNEITKIDTQTGTVIWRMGGLRTQFTIEGAPARPFARQHGVRATAEGELVLLDNSGDPLTSRTEYYSVDEAARTVRLTASFTPSPAAVAQTGGTTQHLPGGRTLVTYGSAGRVEEYDATGVVVWRVEGNPGYVFRAQRIWSLYRPGVGSPR